MDSCYCTFLRERSHVTTEQPPSPFFRELLSKIIYAHFISLVWMFCPTNNVNENSLHSVADVLNGSCYLIYWQSKQFLKRRLTYFDLLIKLEGLDGAVLDNFCQFVASASKMMNLEVTKK